MKLQLYFISKNEQFLSNLQFDSVEDKFNKAFKLEKLFLSSVLDLPEKIQSSTIDIIFLELTKTFVYSEKEIEICKYLNSLDIPIIMVVSTFEDIQLLQTISIKIWRIIKTYQKSEETLYDVYFAMNRIIEYKQIEKEKRYFQETLKVSFHKFLFINENIELVYSSPAMNNLHEYEESELIGSSFLQYIHPDDKYLFLGEIQKVKSIKNYIPHIELRFLIKKGVYILLEVYLKNQLGNPLLNSIMIDAIDITMLKTMENTLKFQEERISKVYSLTSLGIWDWDIVNDTVFISPELCSILGITFSEKLFTFDEFLQFCHHEDQNGFKNSILDSYSNSEPFFHEHRISVSEDSKQQWVVDRGSIVEVNEVGEPIRIIGTTVDITSKKMTELQLQELSELMNKFTENLPGMLFKFIRTPDENMLCTYVSKGIEEMYEIYDYKDGVDLNLFVSRIHPDDVQSLLGSIQASADSLDIWELECRLNLPKKGMRWVHGKSRPQLQSDGTIVWHGYVNDITESKSLALQIQEMNQRMSKLTDSLPGMLYQFVRMPNGSMACTYVSQSIQTLYEIQIYLQSVGLDEFLNRTHPEDVQTVLDTIQISAETMGIWELEYRLVLPQKGLLWIHAKSRPEKLPDGTIVWYGYVHDITEKKRNSELLIRNQRMESIGTLAGGIAHDLNNVLTPIMLSLDILKTKINDQDLLNRIQLIETSTLRGATMVKQILQFSRGMEGNYSSIDIKVVIDEISSMIQSSFPKNISFQASFEQNLPNIFGDMTQIHQVLLNLCVNARDAMPNGGKLNIEVKKIVVNDEREFRHLKLVKGIYIIIFVNDTGTGMSQDVKSRIFEPFYTTKEIGDGTGLGLSTVLNIIQSHKGCIDVYSEIGKGTSFRMYLPTTTKEEEESIEQITIPEIVVENIGVLVIDDEEIIRDFTRYLLESKGFHVYEAENGAEGITVLTQNLSNISLLIVDSMMPVMDGKTTISIAKKLNPELKVILVSGLTQKFDQTKEFESVVFIQKPYSSKQLLAAIHSLIG